MNCQFCESERILAITAKCSDCFNVYARTSDKEVNGEVPTDLSIGGGDYVEFSYCLNCGRIQGTWPLPLAEVEET